MSLKDQLQHDLQEAMRARDERRKSALRMALTAVQLAEVEARGELNDEGVANAIRKEIRRREDALEMIRQSGRADVIAEDEAQLEILRSYLPQMLTVEALTTIAREAIAEAGAATPADMGKVMKVLMPRVQGKADGRMVSQIVRDLLSA
ncbi:MAG TPA: GatB/YqeY domain-containing protein [Anaerolineae bacterium]|nr:GatB/YqeY domain-containing protein [Anaerolineae bacterium]HQK12657.1 GatB/YqeY domain-containing protein [Anaerolineae bacterium]